MVEANWEQMFQLIDSILPFEACLYHQVLPLYLKGTQLSLGMVNPDDTSALDYVRRILAYMNCSLLPQPISVETHQTALSSYLSHTGQQKKATDSLPLGAKASAQKQPKPNRHDKTTLIVYSPDEIEEAESPPPQPQPLSETSNPSPPSAAKVSTEQAKKPPLQVAHSTPAPSTAPIATPAPSGASLFPVLEVHAYHLSSGVDVLKTLPPQQLLNELLGRILLGGIGRIYLERHPESGRILWSQNGVLQSVLEGIDSAVFQGVINELKRLTQMSLISVDKPKQMEIERIYQNNRLLLRLRVMPGTHGEEATLQVLRGAALKFYQQQQIEHISRDALALGQQLQRKVYEIRDRTNRNPNLTAGQIDAIPALAQLVKSIDQQLEAMKVLLDSQPQNEE